MIKINKFIINVFFIIIFLLPLFIFAGAPKIISVTIDPANPGYPGFCNPVRITVTACVNKYTNSYIAIAFSKYSTRQTIATPGQVFVVSYNGVSVGTETINPGSEIGHLFSAANASAPNDCTDCGGDINSWTVTKVYEVYFPDPRYFFNYSTPCDFYLHVGMKDSYLGINDWVGLTTCQSNTTSFTFDSAYLYYDPTYTDIVAPYSVNVGQVFTVTASVTNIGGGTSFNTTIDPLSYFGSGSVSFISRSEPTHITLTSGTSSTFTFVYRADTSGNVYFMGNAKGLDSATGNTIQAQTSCTYINCGGCIATNVVNIQTPATLQASINAYPISVPLGSPFTVVMSVTNTGEALARNVTPSALVKLGSGTCSLISGPNPGGLVDIFGGAAAYFTWVYSATGVGSVGFNGNSSGDDGNTGERITSNNATSNYVFIYTHTPTPTLTLTPTVTQTRTPAPTYATTVGPANYPFPIDCDYANGIRITGYNSQDLLNMYNYWKSLYVLSASPGKRVRYTEPINGVSNRTVSEGQGYGMLLAVYFNDQALFNDLWAFKVARSTGKASQLMPWVIENDGTTIMDPNSAPEADFDIAFALLMAHYQWGSGGTYNYQTLADTEITRCRQYDINADYSVRPGDAWNDWGYPSYYFPAFFRVFGEFQGGASQTVWNSVVAKCLNNINNNRNSSSGLVGEICDVSTGARRSDNPCSGGCDGRLYKYNSCRVSWRYATDWLWYGNAANSSATQVNLMASFFNSIQPENVMDGYRIADNSVEGTENNAAFVGTGGSALMYGSTYSSSLLNYFARTMSFDISQSFYKGTLQLLTLLLMTGNFHDLRNIPCYTTPTSTPTNTTIISGGLLDDMEDGNNQNNWGGYWYTYDDLYLGGDSYVVPWSTTRWQASGQPEHPFYMQSPGRTGSGYAARMTGYVTMTYLFGFVGMGTTFLDPKGPVDLSTCTGIKFWYKGDGKEYRVKIPSAHPDFILGEGADNHYGYTFISETEWTQMELLMSDLTQEPYWGTSVERSHALSMATGIQFETKRQPYASLDLWIDEIEFYGCSGYLTPGVTSTVTSTISTTTTATLPTQTNTPTLTLTFTRTITRTVTPTISSTITGTPPTQTRTPTFTPTFTQTHSRTFTQTQTLSRTFTPTFTLTPGTSVPTPGFTVIIDDIDGGNESGQQIIKLPDGKILVVGLSWDDNCTCYISVIWKYNIDGTLDTSFGNNGRMECPVPGTTFVWEDGLSIYVDISGRIYVTGYVVGCGGTCKNLIVYRCNPDGTIDTSFGSGTGYIIYTQISVNINISIHSYITFDSSGRMIIVSKTWNGSNYDMIVIRCNPDGTLDTTFCSAAGYCTFDYSGGDDAGYKVFIDINFNIYIVGYVTIYGPGCTPSCKAIAVWKLLPDGTPDPSFNGGNCFVYYDILKNHLNCEALSIVVTVTGEIYITGFVDDGSGCVITCKKMIVIKLTATGTIDVTFGVNGIYVFETYPGIGIDIVLDFDYKLVVVGTIYNGSNTDIILWKLLLNGSLDVSYNGIGYSIYDSGRDERAKGLLIYALCTYLVTGYTDVIGSNYDMLVWFDGCSKYPTPTSTATMTPTWTLTRTPTSSATPTTTPTVTPTVTPTETKTITPTMTPTITQTMTATLTTTATFTNTPTYIYTTTTTATFTTTHTPVMTPLCDGTTPPTYTVHLIYNSKNTDYVIIEITSSVVLKTLPVVEVYPHCGCPPGHEIVFTYTAELIPGETKKYRVLYPKQTGEGDIDKVIVKGTDLCNVYGESNGSYTKETISRQDIIVFKNIIRPDNEERSRIVFKIYGEGQYEVKIFSRNGALIKTLFKGTINEQTGESEVIWDGTNENGKKVVSGIYIVVAKSPYYEAMEKIVVIR